MHFGLRTHTFGLTCVLAFCLGSLVGCQPGTRGGDDDDDHEPVGLDILGNGTHEPGDLEIDVYADSGDGLNTPRDLQWNPANDDQLFIANMNERLTVIDDGTADSYFGGEANQHFFAVPAAIAFTDQNTFASIHETDQLTQGAFTPADFMGPTLWTADTNILDMGHWSHLDMLHNTPLGMGIEWDHGNAFWVFDGYHSSITFYDFHTDHGLGGTDHSDGEIARYVEGEVQRRMEVPSHMALDRDSDLLYIADTGNDRIAVLDTRSGSNGSNTAPNYDCPPNMQYRVEGASIETFAEGGASCCALIAKGVPGEYWVCWGIHGPGNVPDETDTEGYDENPVVQVYSILARAHAQEALTDPTTDEGWYQGGVVWPRLAYSSLSGREGPGG